ncbi:MAG: hypothetical protein ACRD2P_03110 [Terriglobia bacterium]
MDESGRLALAVGSQPGQGAWDRRMERARAAADTHRGGWAGGNRLAG